MAVLPIVKAPDSRLKIKSFPVEKVDDDLRKLMDDMLETMYAAEGIGLAAVQVGVHKRVLVMDLQDRSNANSGPLYIVNPEIVEYSTTLNEFDEGCLSFPGQHSKVVRPKKVTIRYLDYDGNSQEMECDELLSTCIQHEIDHLNGIVFVDHLSRMKRDMIMRKLKKQKQADE